MTTTAFGRRRRPVRTLFVSDVHLGCKYSQADAFLHFLQCHEPETIYLVGDFIDGWRLKKSWFWSDTNNRVLRHLIELAEAGVKLVYTPGNHDDFLRHFHYDFDLVEIIDELVHTTSDGRRFFVTHGDKFDHIERCHKWLSLVGGAAYDVLCWSNAMFNRLRAMMRLEARNFSGWAKRRVKRAVQFVSDFEGRLIDHARELGCDGVICGHIHTPTIHRLDELVYCNTGDWVENRSGIVEHHDGRLELIHWDAVDVAPRPPAPLRLPVRDRPPIPSPSAVAMREVTVG